MAYEATVTGVASKTVNRKSDGKVITIFEISDSNGVKWTTSRRDLAGEAQRLIGNPVQIQGRTEMNGTFENHFLEDIQPSGFQNGPATVQHPPTYVPPPQLEPVLQPQQARTALPVAPQGIVDLDKQKQLQIHRQTATKVAVHLSSSPVEFWENVDILFNFYETGQKPLLQPEPKQQNAAAYKPFREETPVTSNADQVNQFIPEHMLAADPGAITRPTYDDSDIPF